MNSGVQNPHSGQTGIQKFRNFHMPPVHLMKNPRTRRILGDDELAELKEAFTVFDLQNNGALNARELKAAIRALGFEFSKDEIRAMIFDIGKEPHDLMKFDDFCEMMRDRMDQRNSKEAVARVFALFDTEGTGRITFRDLKRVSQEIGENLADDEIRELIAEADRGKTLHA